MDADESVALLPLVEGGYVGKADQRLRRTLGVAGSFQLLQQPQGPVAAAGAENCAYGGICDGAVQLQEPALILTCQIPVSLKNPGVVLSAVAACNDGETRVE
jgi:hypothetical protein